jgi:hypothetical protein
VRAKQKLSLLHYRGLALLCVLLALYFAGSPIAVRADSLEEATRNLARQICAAPHQKSVKINWQVPAELSGTLSDSLKNVFASQISACGTATNNNAEFPALNVAIRGTASKLLLVANLVDSGGSRQIRMIEIRRDTLSISNETSRTPQLHRKLLWQQERPLESAMEWYGRSPEEHFLFLASQGSLVRLRFTNEVWNQVDSADLPKADRPSRSGGGGSTFLYGNSEPEAKLEILSNRKLCEFSPAGNLSLRCNDSYPGGKQLRLSSECGETSSWSLRTDTGDYAQRDRIIYGNAEVTEAEFPSDEASSHSLEMPGPVLDISTTVDLKAAIAVVRNISTGNYEVYRISLACAN